MNQKLDRQDSCQIPKHTELYSDLLLRSLKSDWQKELEGGGGNESERTRNWTGRILYSDWLLQSLKSDLLKQLEGKNELE